MIANKKNIFFDEKIKRNIIYRIIRRIIREYRIWKESVASVLIQNTLDLAPLQKSKKIIIFLTPEFKVNGGIMSIFSLCQATREICKDAYCLISTYPHSITYVINDKFYNNEKVLRFDQIVNNAKNVQEMILHIPEYYSENFFKSLNKKDIKFLKSIPNLHINILNQNIELMPEPNKLKDLYKLTNNITQTLAHNRYATQEVCDKYQIPTHLFSVNLDLSRYKTYSFEEKEKIIVLSPDKNEYKDAIVEKIELEFPDWEIITVRNLSFSQYMDLIGRAFFTITFGEGMDGYFNQPSYVGGLGFAIYNDDFFPDESWKNLRNVYSSYEEMSEKICKDFKELSTNKDLYIRACNIHQQKLKEIYNYNNYFSNIERFYKKEYDFLPNYKIKKENSNDFVHI